MELATYHEEVKSLITDRMQEIFADVHDLDLGGKHLRGALCLLICDALGGNRDKALTSAGVIDAVHAATLIHDDIVDEDTERRGQPSLHISEGIKKAVSVGDWVFSIANKRMAMLGSQQNREMAEALNTTAGAWVKEVVPKPAELLVDLFTGEALKVGYQKLCLTKTAPFFKAATRLGGMTVAGNTRILETLGYYGERIGLAYQYADDYVDLVKLQQEEGIPPWRKIAPVIPAIIYYNGRNLHQALLEMPGGIIKDFLLGKGPGEKLIGLLSPPGVTQQLTMDIEKEIENAVNAIEGIKFKEGYKGLVRDYPRYAVNLMLHEVDKELKPVIGAKEEESKAHSAKSQQGNA